MLSPKKVELMHLHIHTEWEGGGPKGQETNFTSKFFLSFIKYALYFISEHTSTCHARGEYTANSTGTEVPALRTLSKFRTAECFLEPGLFADLRDSPGYDWCLDRHAKSTKCRQLWLKQAESWGLKATLPVNENSNEQNDNHCLRPSGSCCEALGFLSSALPFERFELLGTSPGRKGLLSSNLPMYLGLEKGVECDSSVWGDENVLELEVVVAQHCECAKCHRIVPF